MKEPYLTRSDLEIAYNLLRSVEKAAFIPIPAELNIMSEKTMVHIQGKLIAIKNSTWFEMIPDEVIIQVGVAKIQKTWVKKAWIEEAQTFISKVKLVTQWEEGKINRHPAPSELFKNPQILSALGTQLRNTHVKETARGRELAEKFRELCTPHWHHGGAYRCSMKVSTKASWSSYYRLIKPPSEEAGQEGGFPMAIVVPACTYEILRYHWESLEPEEKALFAEIIENEFEHGNRIYMIRDRINRAIYRDRLMVLCHTNTKGTPESAAIQLMDITNIGEISAPVVEFLRGNHFTVIQPNEWIQYEGVFSMKKIEKLTYNGLTIRSVEVIKNSNCGC